MNTISQDLRFKQAVIEYSLKNGVTKAAIRYKKTRQWIYYWRRRYDGTINSLRELSRRPLHHPNEHTESEIKLICDMRRRNPMDGLVDFWVKLKARGYTRTIPALFRVMGKLGYYERQTKKSEKYIPKPYEQMQYPGQRVQIDVKFVPQRCTKAMGEGTKLYQFTAIDEFSRQRYLGAYMDNSTYSAACFVDEVIRYFKFKIECIQTDNGQEFTKEYGCNIKSGKAVKKTLFQERLEQYGIKHKQIRPYTPRHNGKVERSHRKDQKRFYERHEFYSLEDFAKQLRRYNNEYNNFPMRPLGWLSPNEYLKKFYAKV